MGNRVITHQQNRDDDVAQPQVPWAWIKCINDMLQNSNINSNINYSTNEHGNPSRTSTTNNIDLPASISSWLYLSDEASALDLPKLKSMGITHVLSLNGVAPYKCRWSKDRYDSVGIVHKRIHAEDNEGYAMINKHWDECYSFLKQVHDNNQHYQEEQEQYHHTANMTNINNVNVKEKMKVVVHCVSGINRSGVIVCAALMIFEQMEVLKVVMHCIQQRKVILWNKSFRKQLCILAAKYELLGEKPEGYDDEPIVEEPLPPPPIRALDRIL